MRGQVHVRAAAEKHFWEFVFGLHIAHEKANRVWPKEVERERRNKTIVDKVRHKSGKKTLMLSTYLIKFDLVIYRIHNKKTPIFDRLPVPR